MSFENHVRYETDHVCCGCHQANDVTQAVESFRERAMRAIRAMSNIEARNELIMFLKGATWAQDHIASLVERLPLEPEVEQLEGAIKQP